MSDYSIPLYITSVLDLGVGCGLGWTEEVSAAERADGSECRPAAAVRSCDAASVEPIIRLSCITCQYGMSKMTELGLNRKEIKV